VIFHVRQQYMTEVSLAEHNNVVKALPSDRTDQPFGISVLPWGARRCRERAFNVNLIVRYACWPPNLLTISSHRPVSPPVL
jgi:hypothetical protein